MKSNHKSIFVLFGLLILATATALAALPLRSQKTATESEQEKKDDGQVPVIDFANADNPTTKQKGGKRGLNVGNKAIEELPTGVEPLPLAGHQFARLPALPVAQSNAVVLGEITGRRAVLTDGNLGIYSEFSIQLAKVFKDDQGVLSVGGSVKASRLGGAVRFPSGKIQRYTFYSQGYPKQGGLYVLFLKRDEEGDFSILTGYDLSSPGVTPLDSEGPEDHRQFEIYRGASHESFLNDLKDVLRSSGSNTTGEPEVLKAQAQQGNPDRTKKWQTLIPVDEAQEPTDTRERTLRQSKNRRHNSTRSDQILTEQPPDVIYGRIDESPRPAAIPVSQSDAVILGNIVGTQPYLSDDKKNIYTEFSVRVEEVVKTAPLTDITTGSLITVDQEGGALRLKDGRILRYMVGGTSRLPEIHGRYVLFLSLVNDRQDLSILSGYELCDGTVVSLEEGGNASPYAHWDEESFLGILRNAAKLAMMSRAVVCETRMAGQFQ